jgi:hypothetical protein
MEGPSRGHELFEAWLIATYGESARRPGRPTHAGLVACRAAIAVELKGISGRLRAPAQAGTLYHWLATATPTAMRRPDKHVRLAIEFATAGAVPKDAWELPALASAA